MDKKDLILITGGTGFIGFQLTKYLLAKGHKLRLLVRPDSKNLTKLHNLELEIVHGDISDPSSLATAFDQVDIVYHCAAFVSDWGKKSDYHKTNVEGTKNVLEACKTLKLKRFIALSTNDVLGRIQGKIIDESFPLKEWGEPYPDSKIAAEKILWRYYNEFNIPITITYPCWVYGPEDTTFIPHLVEAIRDGDFLYWKKDAHFYPTYIDNLLDQLYLMADHPKAVGQGFLIHDGHSILLKEFCDRLSSSLQLKPVTKTIPYGLAHFAASVMELVWSVLRIKSRPLLTTYVVKNFGSNLEYSMEKLKSQLDWEPPINFDEGFSRTISWLKEQDI